MHTYNSFFVSLFFIYLNDLVVWFANVTEDIM